MYVLVLKATSHWHTNMIRYILPRRFFVSSIQFISSHSGPLSFSAPGSLLTPPLHRVKTKQNESLSSFYIWNFCKHLSSLLSSNMGEVSPTPIRIYFAVFCFLNSASSAIIVLVLLLSCYARCNNKRNKSKTPEIFFLYSFSFLVDSQWDSHTQFPGFPDSYNKQDWTGLGNMIITTWAIGAACQGLFWQILELGFRPGNWIQAFRYGAWLC